MASIKLLTAAAVLISSLLVSLTAAQPVNITAILEKNGQYTTLIRLMTTNHMVEQLESTLNNSLNGLTILAPTDNAFANLPAGTLNSLSDSDKVALIQFHIIPQYLTIAQFQTVSNPLRTQAGGAEHDYPLNVSTSGNRVNVSTGVVNTVLDNTVFTNNSLAIYQIDQVLLPMKLFGPPAPSVAPAPTSGDAKKKGDGDTPGAADTSAVKPQTADGVELRPVVAGIPVVAAVLMGIAGLMWIN